MKFRYGFLTGSGTKTEFQLYTLEPRVGSMYTKGIDISSIDSIIGPNNPNANFRHAPFYCSYKYPGYKTNSIGFVICSWDLPEIEKLATLFINYLRDYLQDCESADFVRYESGLIGTKVETRKKG